MIKFKILESQIISKCLGARKQKGLNRIAKVGRERRTLGVGQERRTLGVGRERRTLGLIIVTLFRSCKY
jgi:hypothetical protein